MNYSELLALSKVGVSADGICCYRVSPVEREDAEVMVVGIRAMTLVQDAWIDNLPNSKRVCLMWIPSHSEAQNDMFDLFVEGEIEKGYELLTDGNLLVESFTGFDVVHNLKTGTKCRINRTTGIVIGDSSEMCYQGQRCGLCKHKVYLMLAGYPGHEDPNLQECIRRWAEDKDFPTV